MALRRPSLAALAAVLLVLSACGGGDDEPAGSGGGGGSGAADQTLRLAFTADMQVPDPDIFYEYEGNVVLTSVYEGLLRYVPGSADFEGVLATSWTVSDDALTYTFTLRDDATFADGTPLTASVMQSSFERRLAVGGGPSYMLEQVASYETPDEHTFVIHLAEPVAAFLDYLAAPYSPKAVNPNVVAAEASGDDLAQGYLASHSAGIGPYEIAEFEPGVLYALERNEAYYGEEPFFERVEISIVPDRSTQRLMLEQGDLDIMNRGLSREALDDLADSSSLEVLTFPSVVQAFWMLNPRTGPFQDPTLRAAMVHGIDRERILAEVYGDYGELSTQLIPTKMGLPPSSTFDPDFDPSALAAAVATATHGTKVDMAFLTDDTGTHQRVCELTQQMLAQAGLDASCRGVPIATFFEWAAAPETGADMLFSTVNPDAVHPDTWLRIFNYTTGPVNALGGGTAEADALMDEGSRTTDRAESYRLYGEAANVLGLTGDFIPIADVPEIFVVRAGIGGAAFQLPVGGSMVIADLFREG